LYNIMALFVELEFAVMAGKQAKILSERHLRYLLTFVGATRYPDRNRIIVLLSVKAGLRAGEIAGLTWDMVLGPSGEIGTTFELHDKAAKKSSGRRVPVHPELHAALMAWRRTTVGQGPVVRSERGGPMTATSIVNWFARRTGGCTSGAALPTRGGARSSLGRPAECTKQAARCEMSSYLRATGQS
jgi:integrase/recombinase XerD